MLNLILSVVVMTPAVFLSCWAIRKTTLKGKSGATKWRAIRIWIGALGMILVGTGLTLYFALKLLMESH